MMPQAAAASKGDVKIKVRGTPRVVDGDTLAYEPASGATTRIRMLGIDAPESKQLCTSASGARPCLPNVNSGASRRENLTVCTDWMRRKFLRVRAGIQGIPAATDQGRLCVMLRGQD